MAELWAKRNLKNRMVLKTFFEHEKWKSLNSPYYIQTVMKIVQANRQIEKYKFSQK